MNLSALQQISHRYWQMMLARSIVTILFGILAFIWPGRTLLFLIYLFGAYALISGMMTTVDSFHDRGTSSYWWMLLISGIVSIIIGLLVFFWTDRTALVLFTFIGAWAIVTGVFEVIAALALPGDFGLQWPLVVGGVLAVIVGIIFIRHPVLSMLTIVWLLGAFAIVYGVVLFIHTIQYRSRLRAVPSSPSP